MSEKMKKVSAELGFCRLICLLLISGYGVHSMSYDYSATTEQCLAEPERAQYGGGIIVNPGFDHNIEGWSVFGKGSIKERISNEGNRFIVAHNRTQPLDCFSQKVQLRKGMLYTFSAWFQVSEGSDIVSVVFKTKGSELVRGGQVIAKHGCWTLLKGGIVANFSSPVEILFESKNSAVEIWADNVSLQPFTERQWRAEQDASIEKVRMRKVRFQITNENGTALKGATVIPNAAKLNFPFGCAMNNFILTSKDYQNWFTSRFKFTTFTNEMKWYSTERTQGQENYSTADDMLKFAKENGISVRGHNILWDDPKYQPEWVKTLTPTDLKKAAAKRMESVVSRYKGQLIAWDVMNENLHFHFYEDKLGQNVSAEAYATAFALDPQTKMFLNEFNTIEYSGDQEASPAKYLQKIKEILSFPGVAGMSAGIGLQGHFASGQPNLAYMRSGLDLLAATGLPIWLTEVTVDPQPSQVLREGYSHPAVAGIIIFAGPEQAGFAQTTLVDQNFKNTPAGDLVDKLIKEWGTGPKIATADGRGIVEISLHHGDYDVTVTHPLIHSPIKLNLTIGKGRSKKEARTSSFRGGHLPIRLLLVALVIETTEQMMKCIGKRMELWCLELSHRKVASLFMLLFAYKLEERKYTGVSEM
ncbi:unnamed protein product [Sphenostylis stenocarpa]|uniref:GH10 domain-containing protein n=1 Tax=Sphenostylis stenocarpa TaxID=92480 RepID=A0AA87BC22_9FABA|nr:unnamed protein product [Sphenostylis stenocarpa]